MNKILGCFLLLNIKKAINVAKFRSRTSQKVGKEEMKEIPK